MSDRFDMPTLEAAAAAIEREADAYESEHPGNAATGPMYEAARIVRRLMATDSAGTVHTATIPLA